MSPSSSREIVLASCPARISIERAVDDHLAPVDQHDEVAQPLRLVHHVRGEQDGLALPPHAR